MKGDTMGPDIDALRMFVRVALPTAVAMLVAVFFTSDRLVIYTVALVALVAATMVGIFRRPIE